MTWRRAVLVVRVLNLYLALLAAVWFGYLVWHATQPRDLVCTVVSQDTLYCQNVAQP